MQNTQIKVAPYTIVSIKQLNSIYQGVCVISNSFDRLKTKLSIKPTNYKIIKTSSELLTCKKLVEDIYKEFNEYPVKVTNYIEAANSSEFIKKLAFTISDTIFKCAAVCNCGNTKKFTDFSLIIMVLSSLNKKLTN